MCDETCLFAATAMAQHAGRMLKHGYARKIFAQGVFIPAMFAMMSLASPAAAQSAAAPHHDTPVRDLYLNLGELKWEKLRPELGDGSPEITILHVDPVSGASQLMIRSPANYHAPRHWHTANETHLVLQGTFKMKHDGGAKEKELGPGGFNYMPGKMIHEGWVGPEGNVLFITVDGPWDLHQVDETSDPSASK